jgi:CheY-like chemotaxis protein
VDSRPAPPPVVLVVDDEPQMHALIHRYLGQAGLDVLHAKDGVEAIGVLSGTAEQPCLVITDMRMPRMGGAELGAWVRSHYPSMPILYISGYMDELPPPANDGSCQALAKPFTLELLLEKVRELCQDTVEIRWGAQPA